MIAVTVYSTPNCPQCSTTKRMMDKKGIVYSEVNLTEHPEKLAEFMEQGFTQAPIVTTDIKTWSGFRFDKIESLAKHIASDRVRQTDGVISAS